VSTAVLRWLHTAQIETAFIDPRKPWQNGVDESFNGRFRDECLTIESCRNRLEAQVGIERWQRHDNEERLHVSLGDRTRPNSRTKSRARAAG
jgi:putative transposase